LLLSTEASKAIAPFPILNPPPAPPLPPPASGAVATFSGPQFSRPAAKALVPSRLNSGPVPAALILAVSNFDDCVNPAAAAGSNGFAGLMLYNEKEQSTDSAGTDVG